LECLHFHRREFDDLLNSSTALSLFCLLIFSRGE
ncbi:unnamed protein product, partial [Rotaria sp. Silwood2]